MIAKPQDMSDEILDQWVMDRAGPVALHLKQKLVPTEGDGAVIFPPTYANIGYNIDTLSDGTRVATIDSVGSQSNRLEPLFKEAQGTPRDRWLVPQIQILLRTENCGECEACRSANGGSERSPNRSTAKKAAPCLKPYKVTRSILDLAHRGADAVVQSCPGLASLVQKAFQELRRTGDAGPLCEIVPTSLVFGVWDSRGGSGEKRPRLVRSTIRAWDVEPLHAAAQYNSVWKALDENQQAELEKEATAKKTKLSDRGLADVPGVFRKVDKLPQYRDGAPNPDARVLGGVIAKGRIEREVTVNLVALRGLRGKSDKETAAIRKYLLGLSLVAATADIDLYLREGCHLRYTGEDEWFMVPRRGDPAGVTPGARMHDYASVAAIPFRTAWQKRWPEDQSLEYTFDLNEAKQLLAKKTEDENPGGE